MQIAAIILTVALFRVEPQQDFDATPGVIHFEDGRTLAFYDLKKFRFGVDPGHILSEPRGLYVQHLNTSLRIPTNQLREVRVVSYRTVAGVACPRPCGIAAVRFAVTTTAGMTATAHASFADEFIVAVQIDAWSSPSERSIPWTRVGKDGAVALNVRRITFGHP